MSRSEFTTPEEILQKTDGGYDIFRNELGRVPTHNISSPLRTGDENPSFGIYKYGNLWFYKDAGGTGDSGTAIQFVQKRYGLSFRQTIEKIEADLGLKNKDLKYNPIVKADFDNAPKKIYKFVEFEDCPFDERHAEYWDKIYLPEDFLRKNNVYRVKSWAIDKKKQVITPEELCFAYYAPDIDRTKILRINVPKELKWTTGVPNSYIWSYYEYENPVEDLFGIKSRKDELILKYLGYDTISFQNESSKMILKNKEKIEKICNKPIIFLGTDPQGKRTSIEVTTQTGWRWFNIQNQLFNNFGIEDAADFVPEFGLEKLDYLIRLKKFKHGANNHRAIQRSS